MIPLASIDVAVEATKSMEVLVLFAFLRQFGAFRTTTFAKDRKPLCLFTILLMLLVEENYKGGTKALRTTTFTKDSVENQTQLP